MNDLQRMSNNPSGMKEVFKRPDQISGFTEQIVSHRICFGDKKRFAIEDSDLNGGSRLPSSDSESVPLLADKSKNLHIWEQLTTWQLFVEDQVKCTRANLIYGYSLCLLLFIVFQLLNMPDTSNLTPDEQKNSQHSKALFITGIIFQLVLILFSLLTFIRLLALRHRNITKILGWNNPSGIPSAGTTMFYFTLIMLLFFLWQFMQYCLEVSGLLSWLPFAFLIIASATYPISQIVFSDQSTF